VCLYIACGNLMVYVDNSARFGRVNAKLGMQLTFKLNRLHTHWWYGKTISSIWFESLSIAVSNRHAKRSCRVILSFVPCLALSYFFTLFHKNLKYFKNEILKTNIVLDFATTSFGKVSFSKKNSTQCCLKYTVVLC